MRYRFSRFVTATIVSVGLAFSVFGATAQAAKPAVVWDDSGSVALYDMADTSAVPVQVSRNNTKFEQKCYYMVNGTLWNFGTIADTNADLWVLAEDVRSPAQVPDCATSPVVTY